VGNVLVLVLRELELVLIIIIIINRFVKRYKVVTSEALGYLNRKLGSTRSTKGTDKQRLTL